MIEAYEQGAAPAFETYALGLSHKHTPEIQAHAGLTQRPVFVPAYGAFRPGIVLTIGMAVDANVLIYERIREELRAGRSGIVAIDQGFVLGL